MESTEDRKDWARGLGVAGRLSFVPKSEVRDLKRVMMIVVMMRGVVGWSHVPNPCRRALCRMEVMVGEVEV